MLPYVLFAFREALHESTGFFPFELLYEQEVREPLDILKEGWEAKPGSSVNVLSHILLMQERLNKMTHTVQKIIKEAQIRQKLWCGRTAREHTLQTEAGAVADIHIKGSSTVASAI